MNPTIAPLLFTILFCFLPCHSSPILSIDLPLIQIEEQLEPNTPIANLTDLINTELLGQNLTAEPGKLKTVKVLARSNYFAIDSKQISFDGFIVRNFELLTTEESIDVDTMCGGVNVNCTFNLEVVAELFLNKSEVASQVRFRLSVQVNDINDIEPSFLQDQVQIDIDLNSRQWSSGLIQIPLKLGYDLDLTKANQIQNYSLQVHSDELRSNAQLSFKNNQLFINLNATSKNFVKIVEKEPVQKLTLIASDNRNRASQTIQLSFKINQSPVFQKNFYNLTRSAGLDAIPLSLRLTSSNIDCKFSIENQTKIANVVDYNRVKGQLNIKVANSIKSTGLLQYKLNAQCGALVRDSALIFINLINKVPRALSSKKSLAIKLNIVSALEDLDINTTDSLKETYEMTFKSTVQTPIRTKANTASSNNTFVTMAYLIAENVANKESSGQFVLVRTDQLQTVTEIIRIEELRNGLYALKFKRKYFNQIKALNSIDATKQGVACLIKFQLSNQGSVLTQSVLFELPAELVKEPELKLGELHLTTPTASAAEVLTSKTFSISLFNSVVLVTVLSIVLILIGLGCFVVSLTIYLLSKIRAKQNGRTGFGEQSKKTRVFHSSQLIETDLTSNHSESGIASGSQSRSTSSSSASSLMQQSLNESIGKRKQQKCSQNIFKRTFLRQRLYYILGKRQDNQTSGPTIMVYDVMPSQQQQLQQLDCGQASSSSTITSMKRSRPNLMDRIYRKTNEIFLSQEKMLEQQIYSISSSSSNSLSPVTTSTIDSLKKDQQQQQQFSVGSDSKQTEKDIIYEWFMQTLSTESNKDLKENLSKTSQLITNSTRSLVPSSSPTSTPNNLNSLLNDGSSKNDYRNEIYRNSHLVLKNYANVNNSNGNVLNTYGTGSLCTYVARPFKLTPSAADEDSVQQDQLLVNQNSKLDQNFLSRLPPQMPPTRIESYGVDSTNEMNSVKNLTKKDDNGQISCV